jgi:hypothetical protein
MGAYLSYQLFKTLNIGTSLNSFAEWKPDRSTEDIRHNARPYFSWTPVNDVNVYVYVDGVYLRSTQHVEQTILGLLFSYNFLPKSWIYFAVNELRDRKPEYDLLRAELPNRLHVTDRAAVLKLKYLYYF